MTRHSPAPRRDLHADVTQRLIAAIQANPGEPVLPWRKAGGQLWLPVNALTGKRYNGINVISLWVAAECGGYASPIWATYKQWSQLDAQVRKGETASPIVFYRLYQTDPNPDREEPAPAKAGDGERRVARASWVFNAAQVDGYTPPEAPDPLGPIERIEAADRFFANTGARIVHGGDRAFYRPSTDTIHMPDEGLFTGTATMSRSESYFAVLGHEACHWTAPAHRLNRQLGKRFADHQYIAEELIAEIGSCLICAELQITSEMRPDHAQYLVPWLRLLKDDNRAIFTAAARASEAVAYLKGLQPADPAAPDPFPTAALAATAEAVP
jgi:antirestriction protein ArdC